MHLEIDYVLPCCRFPKKKKKSHCPTSQEATISPIVRESVPKWWGVYAPKESIGLVVPFSFQKEAKNVVQIHGRSQ